MASPVKTEWISLAVPGGAFFDGYLARPPAGSGPGLVLFQEIFGVNEHIRTVAEQYALDGFVVLAPDVFWRQQRKVDLGYEGEQRQRGIELATKNLDVAWQLHWVLTGRFERMFKISVEAFSMSRTMLLTRFTR